MTLETDEIEAAESLLPPGQDVAVVPPSEVAAPAAIPEGPGALMSAIMQFARDPNFSASNLKVMMDAQERLEDRQAERAFAAALAAAQAEIPQVERRGTVDLGGGKGYAFARLEDMDKVLRPIMAKHGLSIHFDRTQREGQGGGLVVTGTLSHSGGHSKTATFPVPLDAGPGRNNLQAAGSSDSYARRYILEGFFNVVRKAIDDDGKAGGAEFIKEEQVLEIQALALETKTDEKRFLETMTTEARSLEEIETKDFARLKNALLAKKRQQVKRRGDDGGQA